MTGRANQLEMMESGNPPSIGLESPTLDERRKCEEAGPERSHLSSAVTLQLIFHFGRHFFNQHNWLCGVFFLFLFFFFNGSAKASEGEGFVLIPSRCLRLPHHINLRDERYIKSARASSIFPPPCRAERESVLSSPVLDFPAASAHLPPTPPPSSLSLWVSKGSRTPWLQTALSCHFALQASLSLLLSLQSLAPWRSSLPVPAPASYSEWCGDCACVFRPDPHVRVGKKKKKGGWLKESVTAKTKGKGRGENLKDACETSGLFKKKKAKCSHNKSESDIQKHTAVCSMSLRRYSGRCTLRKCTERNV